MSLATCSGVMCSKNMLVSISLSCGGAAAALSLATSLQGCTGQFAMPKSNATA